MTTATCLAPGCSLPGRHRTDCAQDGRCRGCVPAQAAVGHLCERCYAQLAHDLTAVAEAVVRLPVIAARSERQHVSGTPQPGAPLHVDALDLAAGLHLGMVHDPHGDQVGHRSVASVLGSWVADIAATQGIAAPRDRLVARLRAELDWAAHHHPALPDMVAEIRELRSALIGVLGEVEPVPERCHGVACRRCDQLTLYRRPDGSGDVECHGEDCGLLLRADEYARWTRLLAAQARRGKAAA